MSAERQLFLVNAALRVAKTKTELSSLSVYGSDCDDQKHLHDAVIVLVMESRNCLLSARRSESGNAVNRL